ncbi:unnamed protein product [Hymenolepis diminuta]|uniref:Protein HGH1 homolog n=1 Tax=Hymenolepis diminuta TaxID=6216 RepID=A0A0R3SUR9_HYMDI|nr:unnamed protein product [Hymenolepis diminuta]
MGSTEVLRTILQISDEDEYINQLSDELSTYFNLLTGVIVESKDLMSPSNLASDEMFLLTLKCCINFCARIDLNKKLFECVNEKRRDDFLTSLTSFSFSEAKEDAKNLGISLLVNLTVISEWVNVFCNAPFANIIYRKITSKRSPSCLELKLILNLTSSAKMRRHMCEERTGLSLFLALLSEIPDVESRMAIAGIFKNCSFEEECHGRICFISNDILTAVLLPLCDQSDNISEDDRSKLPDRVREVYELKSAKREEDIGVKITLCESLLQLCATKDGRSHLRSLGVYFILREMHRQECCREEKLDKSGRKDELRTQRELVYIIEQIVDQLICEEYERPPGVKSLRDIPLDPQTQEKLEKAKADFLNSN